MGHRRRHAVPGRRQSAQPSGREAVNPYVARLQNLQSAKVIVYGYTDTLPVGARIKQASIASNINLSSRAEPTTSWRISPYRALVRT